MNGSGARQAVPIPSVLVKTARLARRIAHNLYRTVALVATVAIVLLVYLGSPHVGGVALQRHHPVAAAEDSSRTVVVYEESLRSLGRLDALLTEVGSFGSVLLAEAQIVGCKMTVELVAFAREVAGKCQIGKRGYIVVLHRRAERMASAYAYAPLVHITVIAH